MSNTFITQMRVRREHCNPSNYNGANLLRGAVFTCIRLSIVRDGTQDQGKAHPNIRKYHTSFSFINNILLDVTFCNM